LSNLLGDPRQAIITSVAASVHRESEPAGFVEPSAPPMDSFEAVYERYAGRVLNLAWRMTGSEEVARDLAQDIWIKVFQRFDTFEARSEIFTWIHRIAVNHVLNHLKRERRVRWIRLLDRSVGDVFQEAEESHLDRGPIPGADDAMEADERARRVWEAVQTLDPKYRVPLVLHHYEEMSYQEVADAMQLSMAAVETRIHRARKQLSKRLRTLLDAL